MPRTHVKISQLASATATLRSVKERDSIAPCLGSRPAQWLRRLADARVGEALASRNRRAGSCFPTLRKEHWRPARLAENETQGRCRPHLKTGSGLRLAGWNMRNFFRCRVWHAKFMGGGRPARAPTGRKGLGSKGHCDLAMKE